jgi:hypothetical protein
MRTRIKVGKKPIRGRRRPKRAIRVVDPARFLEDGVYIPNIGHTLTLLPDLVRMLSAVSDALSRGARDTSSEESAHPKKPSP